MKNKKPIWFIHHRINEFDDETQRLFYAPQELGYETIACKEVPFNGGIVDRQGQPLDNIPLNVPLIFHGGIGLLRQAQKLPKISPNYMPWIWCDWDILACRSYYAHWGKYLLQQDYAFYPWGELSRLKSKLYHEFASEGKIFVRPDSNDKIFNGELVVFEQFEHWLKYGGRYMEPPPDTLCVVCRPENILAEYRLIIADKKVIAGSQYRTPGGIDINENYPVEIISFAEEVVSVWTPHDIFCLDIAKTESGFKVIECGSINCAGFYKCDLRAIVAKASEIAEREYQDAYGDLDEIA